MSNLYILTPHEQHAFDDSPSLSVEARSICFAIDFELKKEISRLRTNTNKVGFLLQHAYFKACKRFFLIHKFRNEDIKYASRLLGIRVEDVDLSLYRKKIPSDHQKKILTLFNYTEFTNKGHTWIKEEIRRQVGRQTNPKQIFMHTLDLLQQHRIEIPSYHCLAEFITLVYAEFENNLLIKIKKKLRKKHEKLLDSLLEGDDSKSPTLLNQLKTINQSVKPGGIQSGIELFKVVKNIFLKLQPVIETLKLSTNSSAYYAMWLQKAKLSQLKQFPEKKKLYLHLIAFIQHQFYLRQDYFVDGILKAVQSAKNTAYKKLNEEDQLTRSTRRKAIHHLTKTNCTYRTLIDEIDAVAKSPILSDTYKIEKINALLDEHKKQQDDSERKKTELFENSLSRLEKNEDYFEILEKLSIKLQRRVSEIVKVLIFNEKTSNDDLIKAINHYGKNDGQIGPSSPVDFLDKEESAILFDNSKKIKPSLYKILLFIHSADAIKSGELNLKYSYRYKAIHEYLIDEKTWKKDRNHLLKLAQLEHFADVKVSIDALKKNLEEKYQVVNDRFLGGRNPYLSIDKEQTAHITTPALEDKDTEYIAALLEQTGYIPSLQILSDIEKVVQFSDCFKHHSVKHVKQKPNKEAFFAGIMSLGCNIGVRKMAQISVGIKENTLVNTVNWYLSLKNLQAANHQIIGLINKLNLSGIFVADKEKIHSSSDGRKVNVAVDSLIASASYKYHGKDKGVSIYTFIDERQALFHSLVMSSTERDAPYVIDGLIHNEVIQTNIHSTDTHGFTETIFATTHFLGIAFAPRIKNIGNQRMYAFSSRKIYKKRGYEILPSRSINQKLIEKHWDNILRFIVTIKLKETTSSLLFKRLSSYAKDNPLYKALKEFGRIIKSIFILTYYDDMMLRQRIEKQLNRIESSNKFANAVFFANDREFKQATREEQEIATACKILIQNAIVLWNYLYLSQLLANCINDRERADMVSMIKGGSVITWRHINLHGEYNFRRDAINSQSFDMKKIMSLKVA